MRLFHFHFVCALIVLFGQTVQRENPTKLHPAFTKNVKDREIRTIRDEYFRLSARYHIKFDKNVTIGFSEIGRPNIIGTCSYRPDFREIDLEAGYWKTATWLTKVALLFHELNHCYCGRAHDYGNGTMYPDGSIRYIIQKFMAQQPLSPFRPSGYLEDGCPQTIMHPVVLSNECLRKHYPYYVQEMFVRCQPY